MDYLGYLAQAPILTGRFFASFAGNGEQKSRIGNTPDKQPGLRFSRRALSAQTVNGFAASVSHTGGGMAEANARVRTSTVTPTNADFGPESDVT